MGDTINTLNNVTEIINALGTLSGAIAGNAGNIIAGASIAAAVLPPPEGNGWLATVHRAINRLAFNVRHASNANAVKK
jgi:hypothetical protein